MPTAQKIAPLLPLSAEPFSRLPGDLMQIQENGIYDSYRIKPEPEVAEIIGDGPQVVFRFYNRDKAAKNRHFYALDVPRYYLNPKTGRAAKEVLNIRELVLISRQEILDQIAMSMLATR